ncbi:NAD(P)H-dependent flavin oxidoreductase [Oceanospirillum beijerinckii]|uniref:NAD(P)H-dependent flavin oxidoreductase n=1 Tax=Oceanospirillum beijerinckii TaxID=64976 RepID=UPI0003FFAD9C|nr:nitronate monooxygenase [Oceanospirillum beijerinckii]
MSDLLLSNDRSILSLLDLLGTELPIIQAPMAGAQDETLTVAVSKAGGLGSLPCAMLKAEQLDQALATITAQTDKPYNVNFFCHTPAVPDDVIEKKWREQLKPYYQEWGIDGDTIPAGPGRAPFDQQMADVLHKYKPRVVSFHFGLPKDSLLQSVKQMGAKVLSSATTVEEAVWLEQNGVDAIIAQGIEAGGHRGMFLTEDLGSQKGTLELVADIVDSVSVPVIAAGGIISPDDVRAALAAGASAVQVGTAYLLTPEATTSEIHRKALQSEQAQHTELTNLFSGRPARGIVNRLISELGPINPQAPAFPLATSAVAPLRVAAEKQGLGDFSPLWAGQNTTGLSCLSAADLTRKLGSSH